MRWVKIDANLVKNFLMNQEIGLVWSVKNPKFAVFTVICGFSEYVLKKLFFNGFLKFKLAVAEFILNFSYPKYIVFR